MRRESWPTLDHVIPKSEGGTNSADNLVACCRRCNHTRDDTPLDTWIERVARRTGEHPNQIKSRIQTQLAKP
jgi:hypothetical protein